jgi:hypothetical protein
MSDSMSPMLSSALGEFRNVLENWPEFLTKTAAGIAAVPGGVKH